MNIKPSAHLQPAPWLQLPWRLSSWPSWIVALLLQRPPLAPRPSWTVALLRQRLPLAPRQLPQPVLPPAHRAAQAGARLYRCNGGWTLTEDGWVTDVLTSSMLGASVAAATSIISSSPPSGCSSPAACAMASLAAATAMSAAFFALHPQMTGSSPDEPMKVRALSVPAAALTASTLWPNPTLLITPRLLLCCSLHERHPTLLQLLRLPLQPCRPLACLETQGMEVRRLTDSPSTA